MDLVIFDIVFWGGARGGIGATTPTSGNLTPYRGKLTIRRVITHLYFVQTVSTCY